MPAFSRGCYQEPCSAYDVALIVLSSAFVQVTRIIDGSVVLNGGASGVSGAALCGSAGEAYALTMFDRFGDGESRDVHSCTIMSVRVARVYV
jgi:hypothetical protein